MLVEVAKGMFFVPGRRGGRYPYCNSLFIDNRREKILIDPASDPNELKKLKEVDYIILSHFHSDHIRELRLFPTAKIFVHSYEAKALLDPNEMLKLVFFPDEEGNEKWLNRKKRELGGWGWEIGGRFIDGEELCFGGTKIKVIHSPGHTIGHSCFLVEEEGILFSADVDLTDFGPWYGNACSSALKFWESIEKMKRYKPSMIITAHERGIVKGDDWIPLLEKFQRHIEERERKLVELLKTPMTLDEITEKAIIYRISLTRDHSLFPLERRMIRHHLDWLFQRGLVKGDGEKFVRVY